PWKRNKTSTIAATNTACPNLKVMRPPSLLFVSCPAMHQRCVTLPITKTSDQPRSCWTILKRKGRNWRPALFLAPDFPNSRAHEPHHEFFLLALRAFVVQLTFFSVPSVPPCLIFRADVRYSDLPIRQESTIGLLTPSPNSVQIYIS